jgi:hypothetical protein
MMRFMVPLLAALLYCAAAAAAPPSRVEIHYDTHFGFLKVGETTDVLTHDDRTYRLLSESRTVGLISIFHALAVRHETVGRVTPGGLAPDHFTETENGEFKHGAEFDYKKGQVVLHDAKGSDTVPLPDPTWDLASFTYTFAFKPPTVPAMDVNLTNGRHLSRYRYAVAGHEQLETDIGTLDTVHMKKVLQDGDKRAFDLWLAVKRNYLPVRIRFTAKNGSVFNSTVTSLTTAPP